ncbi:MAG: hypothetical protein H0V01_13390 [Bacteroidetes bacterium]|nr:hypothetical protein [Bacteroidota bacterium]HET6245487.1 hypothetical protein [Bacteroidia bacterium]
MKNLLLFFYIVSSLFASELYAQSKKNIKKNKIESYREVVTEGIDEKQVTYTAVENNYNPNGKLNSETVKTKDGKFKKKRIITFDKLGNEIEEEIYNSEGKLKEVIKTKYKDGKKTEVSTFDPNQKLLTKQMIVYNNLQDKTQEKLFDASGKLIEKTNYEYDKRGLRTTKTISDGNGKIISTRKYEYRFY